jgi:hypothetical protein
MSAISKGSKLSMSKSIYSSFGGSKWGMAGGQMDEEMLKKLDIKPSIQE